MATPTKICLYLENPDASDVHQVLDRAGFALDVRTYGKLGDGQGNPPDVFVIDAGRGSREALHVCHLLRAGQAEHFTPILFVTEDVAMQSRRESLEHGADTNVARPFDPAELIAQVQSLARFKERHDLLASRAQEVHRVNKRLQAAYQQIDMELELAKRLQESFLPQTLPNVPGLRFAAKYAPCGRVGGDFYDVFRLDENHVGFYVADAMGHGVPASLLTIFVKTTVQAKEIQGKAYRLVSPDEVLKRLNQNLLQQDLRDQPFITMAYGLLNFQAGKLSVSRAGHPYPLFIPREGPAKLLQMEGSLLGVFDTRYRLVEQELRPGDKVLLYTDGIDAAAFEHHPTGLASFLAAVERLRVLPIDAMVGHLATDLFSQTGQSDDLTILGVELFT